MCNVNENFPAGCQGFRQMVGGRSRRRDFLNGAVGLGSALTLTRLAEKLARSAEQDTSRRPKSLLFLWLQGGPSQLETFDPHPGTRIGGDVHSIATSIPGVQIASSLPATAEQMHQVTLVRSVVSKEGDHERATYHLKTGWRPDPTVVHPSIGSIICHQTPDNIEIPRHVSINAGQWPPRGGYLGPSFDAFQIGDPAQPIPNLTSAVQKQQFAQRLGPLLSAVEVEFQRGRLIDLDRSRTLHRAATREAVAMMNSDQLSAFDIKQEDADTRSAFGDSSFGRGCLAGIRLLQAGVRCVEVELSGWDSHINNHELQLGRSEVLDPALAATLRELNARDLLKDTVVVCGGEFGRTPQINPAGGRDHWPNGFSILLAGGEFRRGYVHGSTNSSPGKELAEGVQPGDLDPSKLVSDMVTVPDLHATLLYALGISPSDENMTPIGRPLRWSDGQVVSSLLG